MNIGGIFAILDDISAMLDDVAIASKIAAQKTAGVLGDDLAVNATMSSKFTSDRELPVLWAIAKGSLLNKVIIVPIALVLSYFAPWAIVPILMLGALYLGFEGVEKIEEWYHHWRNPPQHHAMMEVDEVTEEEKIKNAITTDFILSIEIVVIALGTVANAPLMTQIITTSAIALLATVGVYGLVALLVRMDDFGVKLMLKGEQKQRPSLEKTGLLLVELMPKLVKALSVIGTLAMLLVAGGILAHHLHFLEPFHWVHTLVGELIVGFVAGSIIVAIVHLYGWVRRK